MSRLLLLLLLVAQCQLSDAQNGITGNPDWQIKPVISSGFVMVHRISIGHLVKGFPITYECNISKPSLGNKLWQKENNNPDMGITLQCLDFRNPEELGYAFTAAPYIEIPLSDKDKWWRVHMRLCWGLSYITRSFDIESNHKNVAIGSKINVFAQFRWFWRLKMSSSLMLEPGFMFSHVSNGRARVPNLGLNVFSLSLGMNYFIPQTRSIHTGVTDSATRARSRNELIVIAATGINQKDINGDVLKTYLVSLAYQRNVRNTHKWSLGLDFFADDNYAMDYEEKKLQVPQGFEKYRVSARVGYSYNAGRISFPIELGVYVFEAVHPDAALVSRVGVRYYGYKGLIAHFGLRTHFAVAYNFEYGLGYRMFFGK